MAGAGVDGLTVSDVRGIGRSPEVGAYPGVVPFPIRSRIDAVVPNDRLDAVVAAILAAAHTGEPDDGKVFLLPVEQAVRIRTGETSDQALT